MCVDVMHEDKVKGKWLKVKEFVKGNYIRVAQIIYQTITEIFPDLSGRGDIKQRCID